MFPIISPLSPLQSHDHPFWSVMIPTYNSSTYLESTLLSVIDQDTGSKMMQIEIIDDCSTVNSAFDTISKLGLQDRVSFYQQPRNLGLAGNWNTCIERAKGEVVHILHQDDLVLPGFYDALGQAFFRHPTTGAAFCRYQFIDDSSNVLSVARLERTEAGVLTDWLDKIAATQLIQTPSIVVRRSVYEKLGGFHPDLKYAIDWEMWIRISVAFPIWYEPQIKAAYRIHSKSETAVLEVSGQTFRDIRKSFKIRSVYLSEDIAKISEENSRRAYSQSAFRRAFIYFDKHKIHGGIMLIYQGLHLKSDYSTILLLLRMIKDFVFERTKMFIKHRFLR